MKKKILICAMAAVLSLGSMTVLAAETTEEAQASYSYLTGQQRAKSRNDLYAQAAEIESEEERAAFLAEHGISDTEWSEEAAAGFGYVSGRARGSAYRTDDANDNENSDMSAYSYVTGQQRGASYSK